MSTTLTIRNLDESVKRGVRLLAASHQRSMEAEVRQILAAAVKEADSPRTALPRTPDEMRQRLRSLTGIWRERAEGRTTGEIMKELRGND